MLDHITLKVSNLQKSKIFYEHALKPLGYLLLADEMNVGFGTNDKDGSRDFWLKEDMLESGHSFSCLAFKAKSKQVVDAFYTSAIEAGGKDNGAPGYRPEYHRGYYAAFVLDLDGYNIEAVFDDISC